MGTARCFSVRERVETYSKGDELVAYRPGQDAVHVLNATAARILELCDGRAAADIVRELHASYPDQPADALRSDVEQTLAELVSKGLVEER